MAKKVTTIMPTLARFTEAPIAERRKRKVAAYARVSTDSDEQYTSYEAQIDYYTQYIKARDDSRFVSHIFALRPACIKSIYAHFPAF